MEPLATLMPPEATSRDPLWAATYALVDAAPSLAELRWHRLHLLAAERWREQGKEIPGELEQDERLAGVRLTAAAMLLERIRDAYDGRWALIKGYEVAVRFPNPLTRPFADVDVLVEDALGAHQALRDAGFVEIGDPERYLEIHHLRPLSLPGLAVPVEIHHAPKWPRGLEPPSTEALLAAAVPSATGIPGVMTLDPADHALVLAAHSWAHLPLRRLLELVDTAVMAREADPRDIEARARACGFQRVWKTTKASVDSLFYGGPSSSAQRLWARHLAEARERTVFESHVERWLSPFWSLPPQTAIPTAARTIGVDLSPAEGEGWSGKLTRMRKALRNAFSAKTAHERELGHEAHRKRRSS